MFLFVCPPVRVYVCVYGYKHTGNASVTDVTFSATYSQTLSSTALVRDIEKTKPIGHRVR